MLASGTMPEERNNPSTRLSRLSATNVVASLSGLKVVRLRLIAQEAVEKVYLAVDDVPQRRDILP